MKLLLVKLGVILIGLAIFGYAEVWGADWRFFADSEKGKFFYDVESITRPSKNIVRVWIKQVYTDKMGHLLSSTAYSKNGQVLESFNPDMPKWDFLPPESIAEMLYKAVCK